MAGECHPVGGEENSRIRNKNDDAGENDPFMLPAVAGPREYCRLVLPAAESQYTDNRLSNTY
jgi:hypothetical protein